MAIILGAIGLVVLVFILVILAGIAGLISDSTKPVLHDPVIDDSPKPNRSRITDDDFATLVKSAAKRDRESRTRQRDLDLVDELIRETDSRQ